MDELTDKVLSAALARPSGDALDVMRLSVVDWMAVGIAGRDEPVSRITRKMVLAEGGQGASALFGGGHASARAAALVNGATSHALDLDDTHFAHIGHPSVTVLPAALAVAEELGRSKTEFLRAALAGCEASIRFGIAFGRGHYQVGFHQTATAGAFGASVAAALLLSDERAVMDQAIGIVSTRASGLKSQFGTMGKPYNAGLAAANGVEAAKLAALGFRSSQDALSGPLGFLETHHCDGHISVAPGFLMQDVSLKFHACCHGLHATLEALEGLKPLDPDVIRRIEIRTHPRWLSVCNKPAPATGLEAKFSYVQVVALSLLGYDTARLDSFAEALCVDPDVVKLRQKVQVVGDDAVAETAVQLSVLADGPAQEAGYDIARPEPYPARAEKLRGKVSALLGEARSETVWHAVHGPDEDLAVLAGLMA